MQVIRSAIHTGVWVLLASIVLGKLAYAVPKDLLVIHDTPQAVQLAEFTDAALAPAPFAPEDAKLTIVHLWATWCVPCVEELPELDVFAGSLPDGLALYPVALNGSNTAIVQAFYKKHGIKNLPVFLDPKMKLFRSLQTVALPSTFFFNEKGEIVARADGPLDWKSKEISLLIKKYLQ